MHVRRRLTFLKYSGTKTIHKSFSCTLTKSIFSIVAQHYLRVLLKPRLCDTALVNGPVILDEGYIIEETLSSIST